MKHAGPAALDDLHDVLAAIRRHASLRERRRGTFYLGVKAFLHFHEDRAGPFADVWTTDRWTRLRVATKRERATLVRTVGRLLAEG